MIKSPIFGMGRRIAAMAISVAVVVAAWHYSACEPLHRAPDSPWIPMAFSSDGSIVAAADSSDRKKWWTHEPGGPIHLLGAADLAPQGSPIETPTVDSNMGRHYPPLEHVEFSPNGRLLAVIQGHRDSRKMEELELHLIRLPEGDIVTSIPIPFDRWHKRGGVARRLFSSDGRWMAWHEYAHVKDRHDIVRVWDVRANRELFAIERATYPVMSTDGSVLAVAEPYRQEGIACRLYDVHTGKLLHSLPLAGDDSGWQPWPEFTPNGKLLVANSRSSTGKGPAVRVFDVATGKAVFDAAEWSPHFLGDRTLVTVKDDAVLFRATDSWNVRSRSSFSLGNHWASGSPISPEPMPVANREAVLVYQYYPSFSPTLADWSRLFRLDFHVGHRASWIDGRSGATTEFTAGDGVLMRTVASPTGDRLIVQGSSCVNIWALPPRRSWIPTAVAVALVAVCWAIWWLLLRRRRRMAATN